MDWIVNGERSIYKLAVEFFSRITRHTAETQEVVILQAALITKVIDSLALANDAELTQYELTLLHSLAQTNDAKRLVIACMHHANTSLIFYSFLNIEKLEFAIEVLLNKEGYLNDDNKNRAYRLASLISDADKIGCIKLDRSYVESQIAEISDVLRATVDIWRYFPLVDLISPFPNFSVSDHNKDVLGDAGIIEPLLKVVSITTPPNRNIAVNLRKSRVDAGKVCMETCRPYLTLLQTLWNLAFTETNKQRIKSANGVDILRVIASNPSTDSELADNAKGVLWMLGVRLGAPVSACYCARFLLTLFNSQNSHKRLWLINSQLQF